jgi:putative addiction module antidote
MTLKLRAVGTNTGVILPPELLAQLGLKEGDEVLAEPTRDGLILSRYDPEVQRQLQMGEEFMEEYRDTFHELAK